MLKKSRILLALALLLLSSATAAQAVLVSAGPPDPANNFPTYYQDGNGLALAPCFDPVNCILLGAAYPGDPFNPANPVIFPTNFPGEFFYWFMEADPASLPASVKVIRFALEGSFATVDPIPAAGQQVVFSRFRIRMTPPVAGATYTFTHPYGVASIGPADLKNGEYRMTQDIPLGVPLDFTSALNGNVGPFLTWDAGAPAGFIGDGVTPHTVTGSPTNTNFVRIDGPAIGGAGVNSVTINLFVVAGQIFAGPLPGALTVDRATYERTVPGGTVSVFAHSTATSALTFQGAPNLPSSATGAPIPQPMTGDLNGQFFGQATLADASILPATVTVQAVEGTVISTANVPLKDLVTINSAIYELTTNTLTVRASSSDQGAVPPTLTAVGYGDLLSGVGIFGAVTTPPGSVTISSTAGGQATAPVTLVSAIPLASPVAVDDTATTTMGTPVTIPILANDTGTLTASTVALTGGPVAGTAIVDPITGIVTYRPNAGYVGTDIFNYTVSGPGGLSNAGTVSIAVRSPVTNEVLRITRAVYIRSKNRWAIEGTSSARSTRAVTNWITAHLGTATGPQVGQPAVVPVNIRAGGVWSIVDQGSNIVPAPGASVTVISSFGTKVTVPLRIRK